MGAEDEPSGAIGSISCSNWGFGDPFVGTRKCRSYAQ